MKYQTAAEIEIALSCLFDSRRNMVAPNISWGLGLHECDVLVLTKAGHAIEIEIKVSKSDLKKDAAKRHGHNSDKLRRLYFAIPKKLWLGQCLTFIPDRAGVIVVDETGLCTIVRNAAINSGARKFTPAERIHLGELAAMRYWDLRRRMAEKA
jgi:hypothetical protein